MYVSNYNKPSNTSTISGSHNITLFPRNYRSPIVRLLPFQKAAEETKLIVEKEETEAERMTAETQEIAADAQRDLGLTTPSHSLISCCNVMSFRI